MSSRHGSWHMLRACRPPSDLTGRGGEVGGLRGEGRSPDRGRSTEYVGRVIDHAAPFVGLGGTAPLGALIPFALVGVLYFVIGRMSKSDDE